MRRTRVISGKKLLVASIGIAAASYVGCSSQTSGNLIACTDCAGGAGGTATTSSTGGGGGQGGAATTSSSVTSSGGGQGGSAVDGGTGDGG